VQRTTGSGSLALRFDSARTSIEGEITGARARYQARLAGVRIEYALTVGGSFESSYRVDGDRLVIETPARDDIRASAKVTFDGLRPQRRTLTPSLVGTYTLECSAAEAVLRPEDASLDPITLRRVKS
jgi:hypothetical protein